MHWIVDEKQIRPLYFTMFDIIAHSARFNIIQNGI